MPRDHHIDTATSPDPGPPGGASADGRWPTYLHEICGSLWPAPSVVTVDDGWHPRLHAPRTSQPGGNGSVRPVISRFVIIPGIRRPPLLAPDTPRVAASALRHYSGQRARSARAALKGLSLCLASGLGSMIMRRVEITSPPGADTIETYLRSVLSREIQVSVYLGPPRANRKPVLQLLTPTGEAVAFAKVGINPLTCRLVEAEHASLAHLGQARLRELVIPRLLHHGHWRDLDVLVLSPLPAWQHRRFLPQGRLAAAMNEVARVYGVQHEPLAGGEYLRSLRDRVSATDQSQERATLLRAVDDIAARAGGATLTYGAWHGDWSPWNMANTERGLFVWDWERFTRGVPLGFDALHYWLQAKVGRPGRSNPLAAALECPRQAALLLAPFGVEAGQARLTAILYMIDVATRYLADRQAELGARLGAPGEWLVPAIASEVARL